MEHFDKESLLISLPTSVVIHMTSNLLLLLSNSYTAIAMPMHTPSYMKSYCNKSAGAFKRKYFAQGKHWHWWNHWSDNEISEWVYYDCKHKWQTKRKKTEKDYKK